ncbi:flagellar motor switch protein FliN [Nesterenkonia sp. NBAIMH1]|uniref:flagellar motor switch protein FliN n=1 Tax=Nesterenkonia sp. NBAIMH1 TaxID=2600320 RepID=UPI0011B67985|nr:flagellar motor switch protein FliN [Nesterenkonia sp. NBAIMH1]
MTKFDLLNDTASAVAQALPTRSGVSAEPAAGSRSAAELTGAGSVAVTTLVGAVSADLAIHLDPAAIGGSEQLDPQLVSLDDVLRPAFEAAAAVLGTGVLSAADSSAARTLLEDESAELFVLQDGSRAVGWYAVRVRDSERAGGGERSLPSVGPAGADVGSVGDVTSRLSRLHNVHMGLTVEIGRTRVSVRDVLDLEPGAVIELDRNAGAPADVRLNGRLIAQGEVVVMDQDYGVRITRILDAAEGSA